MRQVMVGVLIGFLVAWLAECAVLSAREVPPRVEPYSAIWATKTGWIGRLAVGDKEGTVGVATAIEIGLCSDGRLVWRREGE